MKIRLYGCFLLLAIIASCAGNNTLPEQKWYKGNLHAHSYWSDGNEFPEVIMDWYRTQGYNFTVLSDHNTLAEGDKWITLSDRDYLQKGFQDYLQKYGEEWVTHRPDTAGRTLVKLKTFDEYAPRFQEDGVFLIIPSEEITTNFEDSPIHINATNIRQKIVPKNGGSVSEVIQNNIDAILEQRERLNIPIMPHINHPNFGYGISVDDFLQLNKVLFFEVYNGHPLVHNQGDSTHLGTEEMWDRINLSYIEQGKPLLYGVAADDSHHYHKYGKDQSNPGRGWVMVQADSLHSNSIIEAMEQGGFYTSTGVLLQSIEIGDNTMKIVVETEPDVSYQIQLLGLDSTSKKAKILKSVAGAEAIFDLRDAHLFARARVISNKTNQNVFDETEHEKAWTQPVLVKH